MERFGAFAGALIFDVLDASNALGTDRLVAGSLAPIYVLGQVVADGAFPVF